MGVNMCSIFWLLTIDYVICLKNEPLGKLSKFSFKIVLGCGFDKLSQSFFVSKETTDLTVKVENILKGAWIQSHRLHLQ